MNDGVTGHPVIYDGPTRIKLAQKAGIPLVLCMVLEQYSEGGTYHPERSRHYLRAIDPNSIQNHLPVTEYMYEEMKSEFNKGKRWDRILEMAYLRDNEHCFSYTPDISTVPTFFRETGYIEKKNNEAYEIESGHRVLEEAEEAGLDYILAIYRDTLRIDNEFLFYHNRLYDIEQSRMKEERWESRRRKYI